IIDQSLDFSLDGIFPGDVVQAQGLLAQVGLVGGLDRVIPGGAQYGACRDYQDRAVSRAEHGHFSAGNWWMALSAAACLKNGTAPALFAVDAGSGRCQPLRKSAPPSHLIVPKPAFLRHMGLSLQAAVFDFHCGAN